MSFSLSKILSLHQKIEKYQFLDIAIVQNYIGDIRRWRKTGSYHGYIPPIVVLDLIQCRWCNEGRPHLNQDLIRLIGDFCCENKLVSVGLQNNRSDMTSLHQWDIDTGIMTQLT